MEMDIRTTLAEIIDTIRFADEPKDSAVRHATKLAHSAGGCVYMEDEYDDHSVRFDSAEQVRNCIAALQKALELGWLE